MCNIWNGYFTVFLSEHFSPISQSADCSSSSLASHANVFVRHGYPDKSYDWFFKQFEKAFNELHGLKQQNADMLDMRHRYDQVSYTSSCLVIISYGYFSDVLIGLYCYMKERVMESFSMPSCYIEDMVLVSYFSNSIQLEVLSLPCLYLTSHNAAAHLLGLGWQENSVVNGDLISWHQDQ